MANTVDVIEVLVKAEVAEAIRGLQQTEKKSNKLTDSLKKISSTLSKTVTPALLGLGVVTVKAASDLGESINAVNVTFKNASETITTFGETAAESVGLSQNSFNELATVIGAQLKQSGLDIDTVADQTINLTQRAADLASVFNVDVADATSALGSALRGEAEPARRFGINISDAAVQAEALASGLVNSKNEITDQIKVQARLALIFKQSADVAGDFANTSDSLANTTKILKANLENTAAELGQALLPAVTDVAAGALELVRGFNELDEGSKQIILVLAGIVAAAPPAIGAITAIGTALNVSSGAVGAAFVAFGALLAAIIKLKKEVSEYQDVQDAISDATSGAAKNTETYNIAIDALNTKIETATAQQEALANSAERAGNAGRRGSEIAIDANRKLIEQRKEEVKQLEAQLQLVKNNAQSFEASEKAKQDALQASLQAEIEVAKEGLDFATSTEKEKQSRIEAIREQYRQLDIENENKRSQASADASIAAIQKWREFEEEKTRITKEQELERKEFIGSTVGALGDIFGQYYSSIVSLGDKATEEQKEQAKKAFNIQKGISIAETIINTAQAIMKGYSVLGPIGGTVAAAVLGGIGATQVGIIASQQPAFANGGSFMTGSTTSTAGATVGDNAGSVERVTVEPISSRNIAGAGNISQPIIIQINDQPIYEGLLRASQDGIALLDSRAVIA